MTGCFAYTLGNTYTVDVYFGLQCYLVYHKFIKTIQAFSTAAFIDCRHAYISTVKKEMSSDMKRSNMNTQLTIDMTAPV